MVDHGTRRYDPRLAWLVMLFYWLVGGAVGRWMEYDALLIKQLYDAVSWSEAGQLRQNTAAMHWSTGLAVLITIVQQVFYYNSTNACGRPFSYFTLLVFPLLNGMCESFLFFFFFDLGVHATSWYGSHALDYMLGFSVFSVYSGIIHATMWDKVIFPEHNLARKEGEAKPSVLKKVGGLIVMSLSWFQLYFMYDAIFTIVLLHIIVDIGAHLSIHMPSPFSPRHTPKRA